MMDGQTDPTRMVVDYNKTIIFKIAGIPDGAAIDTGAIYWGVQQTESWCTYNAPRMPNGLYHTPKFKITLKPEYQETSGTHPMVVVAVYAPNGIGEAGQITHGFGFQFYKE